MSTDNQTSQNNNYIPLGHSWEDPWQNCTVSLQYRFSKPTVADIRKFQTGLIKNPAQATVDLLLSCVHKDDKQRLISDQESYPALTVTLSNLIIKAIGIADLGN